MRKRARKSLLGVFAPSLMILDTLEEKLSFACSLPCLQVVIIIIYSKQPGLMDRAICKECIAKAELLENNVKSQTQSCYSRKHQKSYITLSVSLYLVPPLPIFIWVDGGRSCILANIPSLYWSVKQNSTAGWQYMYIDDILYT